MFRPIIFIHRTSDPQLNSILETLALSVNDIGGVVENLQAYTTPVNAVNVPNFTQPTPTAGVDYLVGSALIYSATNTVSISVSCETSLSWSAAVAYRPLMTLKLVRKLSSAASYNIAADTVATQTFRSNNTYNGADTFYNTFVFPGVYDRTAVDYYDYGLFLSYSTIAGTVTPTTMGATNTNITITVLR